MRKLLTSRVPFRLYNAFRFSTVKQSETALFSNSFLNSANVNFLENQYAKWVTDPSSVPQTFAKFFNSLATGETKTEAVADK